MRRFWIALYTLTAVAHAPFAVGLARALSRASVPSPALFAALLSIAAAGLIRGRVANARMDAPIARWKLYLVEEPFYVHWCATMVSAPLFLLGALVILVAWALTGIYVRWANRVYDAELARARVIGEDAKPMAADEAES